MKCSRLSLQLNARRSLSFPITTTKGFTLVEILVSSLILVVAVVGSIAGFNLITQSVRGTGVRADQNRRIDADIAELTRISELYTSCVSPRGSVLETGTPCPGRDTVDDTYPIAIPPRNSFYYFPDPDNVAFADNQDDFFDACRTDDDEDHVTAEFIREINEDLPQPGGDVTRENAERLEPGNGDSHLVRIRWTDPTRTDAAGDPRELRSVVISPIVSSWCP